MAVLDPTLAEHAAILAELEGGPREHRALLLNLREEDRLPAPVLDGFHRALSAAHGDAPNRVTAACRVHLRQVPVDRSQRPRLPSDWCTVASLRKLQRLGYATHAALDPSEAPPRLTLIRRYLSDQGWSLWIAPRTETDADDLRDRLGLFFLSAGEAMYRVMIPVVDTRDVFVPTVCDSEGYTAWRRPPRTHSEPWGLTRNLETDDCELPELVTLPHTSDPLAAEFVGTTTRPSPDGFYARRDCA